jgi:hypothetical protein
MKKKFYQNKITSIRLGNPKTQKKNIRMEVCEGNAFGDAGLMILGTNALNPKLPVKGIFKFGALNPWDPNTKLSNRIDTKKIISPEKQTQKIKTKKL